MNKRYLTLLSLSGFIFSLDQCLKYWARYSLTLEDENQFFFSILSFKYIQNKGFIFGLLKQIPQPLRNLFFIGIPVFALVLMCLIFIKLQDEEFLTSLGLSLILSGALGNLVDRIHFGYVIDFLKINATFFPPLNVADLSIMAGVTLMFISTLRGPKTSGTKV